jgi:hypothetical protein
MAYRDRFVGGYLDPLRVEAEISRVAADFPTLCRLEALPFLTHGYEGDRVDARGRHPMHVLRITAPGPTPKPGVLLLRSPHAREWINPMAVVEAARQLVENYRPADPDPSVAEIVHVLDRVEVLIVPEGNPDGARRSFFDVGERFWRKNLRPSTGAGTCPGVDCNRNYPQYFGEEGSSADSCTEICHGPSPLSEPESANVAHLVETNRRIVFAVDSHSHGQALFRPHPDGGTYVGSLPVSADDHAVYGRLESSMNARIRTVQGVEYSTGTTSNHAGTSDEYLFFRHRVFTFDLECGTDFQPAEADAVLAALEVVEAVKALVRVAAGGQGVDVGAILEARAQLPAQPVEPPVYPEVSPTDRPRRSKPEDHRLSLVEVEPRTADPATERLRLLEAGFDMLDEGRDRAMRLLASAREIAKLRSSGYRPRVLREYASAPGEAR